MNRDERRRENVRLAWFVLAALLLELLLLPHLSVLLPEPHEGKGGRPTPIGFRQIDPARWDRAFQAAPPDAARAEAKPEARPKPPEPPPSRPPEPPEPLPDGQIVDLAPPEKEQKPDEARFLSEFDTSVEKESRSRQQDLYPRPASRPEKGALKDDAELRKRLTAQPGRIVLDSGPARPGREGFGLQVPKLSLEDRLALPVDPESGTVHNRPGQARTLNGRDGALRLSLGDQQPREGSGTGNGEVNIPPELMPDLGSIEQAPGGPMNDWLQDVEEGDSTWLNSRQFKYASFFNRVKRQVSMNWKPGDAARKYDPYFNINGYKDRYTLLSVTLDRKGALDDLALSRSCGVDYLDRAAMQAMQLAQPFPNPPEGLLDGSGRVNFPFGFYFEVSRTGFRIFNNGSGDR